LYESYIEKESVPAQFVRKINEGGYTKKPRRFLINLLIKL
jgi:hypothetical protein